MLKQDVQTADDQPPEHKAEADPQEERLMGRPSVFVCSYLLPNAIISVEHIGGKVQNTTYVFILFAEA